MLCNLQIFRIDISKLLSTVLNYWDLNLCKLEKGFNIFINQKIQKFRQHGPWKSWNERPSAFSISNLVFSTEFAMRIDHQKEIQVPTCPLSEWIASFIVCFKWSQSYARFYLLCIVNLRKTQTDQLKTRNENSPITESVTESVHRNIIKAFKSSRINCWITSAQMWLDTGAFFIYELRI